MSNPFEALAALQATPKAPVAAAPATTQAPAATTQTNGRSADDQAKLDSGDYVNVNGRLMKKTKVWLKFGMLVPTGETEEDGTPVRQFAGLPKDLPLDTMDASSVSERAKPETQARVAAENFLHKTLVDAGMQLEPGDHYDMVMGGDPKGVQMVVRVQRVAEKSEPTSAPGENAMINAIAGFFQPS